MHNIFLFLLHFALLQQEPSKGLEQLVGTWKMETSKGALYEQWVKLNAQEFSGKSYRISGSDTIIMETVQLMKEKEDLVYRVSVPDQNEQPVSFRLISQSNNKWIFENKMHDFPQRIIYKFVGTDSIAARIEGLVGGTEKSSDFNYKRVQ
ncbi:DUF6265 family protein [Aridibaculum aurantiacum]|uniref:DUF6265 family protein n=1 Tax=Aridibaculum aurantiacum TaxID=2810307 RepID=UPI001A9585BF|nr:DUF6265 family protein [Aridibaculum aurantiacum]